MFPVFNPRMFPIASSAEKPRSPESTMFLYDKSMSLEKTSPVPAEEGHTSLCTYPNCDEVMSRFAECNICLEPLQCSGPYACDRCGGLWCARCSPRLFKCAWCRNSLSGTAAPCMALQSLINRLLLPCRNKRLGCTELLTAETREEHEKGGCKFYTINCPCGYCSSSLTFEDLGAHMQSRHNITAYYSQKVNIVIKNYSTKIDMSVYHSIQYFAFLLYEKKVFTIVVTMYNYHISVVLVDDERKYGALISFPEETEETLSISVNIVQSSNLFMKILRSCHTQEYDFSDF